MGRYILEGVSPEVFTAAFRGDVKPSVPGCWLVLAFSCWSPCFWNREKKKTK